MPRKAKDVTASLLRKGFRRRNGGDKYYHLHVDGKKTPVFTFVSHGEKEIHDGLLRQMAIQTRLPRARFLDLVDCPLSAEEYLKSLRDGGHIPSEDDEAGSERTPE